jgi:hypothetical protein
MRLSNSINPSVETIRNRLEKFADSLIMMAIWHRIRKGSEKLVGCGKRS